jgi:hypothetical protein
MQIRNKIKAKRTDAMDASRRCDRKSGEGERMNESKEGICDCVRKRRQGFGFYVIIYVFDS